MYKRQRFDRFDALRRELSLPVAALLDTKGPEIRLKTFANKKVQLEKGQLFTLRRTDEPGDETGCGISYERLYEDVQPGCTILLDDGLIGLTVEKVENTDVYKRQVGKMWELADLCCGLMALPNLAALLALRGLSASLLRESRGR